MKDTQNKIDDIQQKILAARNKAKLEVENKENITKVDNTQNVAGVSTPVAIAETKKKSTYYTGQQKRESNVVVEKEILKKSHSGRSIFLVLLLCIILAGTGVGLFFVFKNSGKRGIIYTVDQRAEFVSSYIKFANLTYPANDEPSSTSMEYWNWQAQLEIAQKLPEIFRKQNVATENFVRITKYMGSYQGKGFSFDFANFTQTDKGNLSVDAIAGVSELFTFLRDVVSAHRTIVENVSTIQLAGIITEVVDVDLNYKTNNIKKFQIAAGKAMNQIISERNSAMRFYQNKYVKYTTDKDGHTLPPDAINTFLSDLRKAYSTGLTEALGKQLTDPSSITYPTALTYTEVLEKFLNNSGSFQTSVVDFAKYLTANPNRFGNLFNMKNFPSSFTYLDGNGNTVNVFNNIDELNKGFGFGNNYGSGGTFAYYEYDSQMKTFVEEYVLPAYKNFFKTMLTDADEYSFKLAESNAIALDNALLTVNTALSEEYSKNIKKPLTVLTDYAIQLVSSGLTASGFITDMSNIVTSITNGSITTAGVAELIKASSIENLVTKINPETGNVVDLTEDVTDSIESLAATAYSLYSIISSINIGLPGGFLDSFVQIINSAPGFFLELTTVTNQAFKGVIGITKELSDYNEANYDAKGILKEGVQPKTVDMMYRIIAGAGSDINFVKNNSTDKAALMKYLLGADEDGNEIPDKNAAGEIIYLFDKDGKPIFKKDAMGNPIQKTDENGQLVVDENSRPVYEQDYKTIGSSSDTVKFLDSGASVIFIGKIGKAFMDGAGLTKENLDDYIIKVQLITVYAPLAAILITIINSPSIGGPGSVDFSQFDDLFNGEAYKAQRDIVKGTGERVFTFFDMVADLNYEQQEEGILGTKYVTMETILTNIQNNTAMNKLLYQIVGVIYDAEKSSQSGVKWANLKQEERDAEVEEYLKFDFSIIKKGYANALITYYANSVNDSEMGNGIAIPDGNEAYAVLYYVLHYGPTTYISNILKSYMADLVLLAQQKGV